MGADEVVPLDDVAGSPLLGPTGNETGRMPVALRSRSAAPEIDTGPGPIGIDAGEG